MSGTPAAPPSGGASTGGRGASFVARLGAALVRPRAALAQAGDREHAGRSGSDLVALLVLLVFAAQLATVVAAVWLAVAVDVGSGARGVLRVLTSSVTGDLAFLVIGAVIVFAAAGARRDLGRAFDLACVAAIPLVFVHHGASVVVRALEVAVPPALSWAIWGMGCAWAGALLALGIGVARARGEVVIAPPRGAAPRRAGWALLAFAAVGLGVQGVWIAQHFDWMRPVQAGDRAPIVALPTIGAGGALGAVHVPPAGAVVVIDFWATWCTPCLQAMPKLEALQRTYGSALDIVAVNMDDPEAARELWDRAGYTMTLVRDDGPTSQRFHVGTIPHTVVIHRDGRVAGVVIGSSAQVEALVRTAVAVP